MDKCPGSDLRFITIETIKCSNCQYDVEIFTDEPKGICPKCKKEVTTNAKNVCFLWCKFAGFCRELPK